MKKLIFIFLFLIGISSAAIAQTYGAKKNYEVDSTLYYYDSKGEIFNEGSIVTILNEPCIVLRSNKGQDGLVMSLNWRPATKEQGKICASIIYNPSLGGAFSNRKPLNKLKLNDDDFGVYNLMRIYNILDMSIEYNLEDLHMFNTIVNMGNGWYIPAKNELNLFFKAIGVVSSDGKKEILNKVNSRRVEAGLKPVKKLQLYSSTETDYAGFWDVKYWALDHKHPYLIERTIYLDKVGDLCVVPVHLIKSVD